MKKISSQISGVLAGLFLVGFVLLLLVVDSVLKNKLQSQIIEDLKIQCRLVDTILPENSDSIQSHIHALAAVVQARITVIDERGHVLAESEHRVEDMNNHLSRPEILEALKSDEGFGSAIRFSETIREDLVYTAYRTDHHRFVRLAKQQYFIDHIVWNVRIILVLAAAGAILLVITLAPRVLRRVTKPLSDIVSAAEEIKGGNYDKEIIVAEDNEVGELGKILNGMSAKLKADIRELSRMQEIRKDFVANASHELRTPVSSIRGYVETLLDGAYHDKDVSRKFLERTLSNVIRLENIVNDMLDLSRLELRDRGLSLRYFDLAAAVQNVMADFEQAAAQKSLMLSFTSSLPKDFTMMADPYQVEKALVNLIENALAYTDKGTVRVEVFQEEKTVIVKVEDTGNGINSEDLPRIFERFYRADKGRSREHGGSGLGLSIVKHIMEMHKGHVAVESEVGKGTKFLLTFPQ
jgi:signal transduction histidine kinase